MNDGWVRSITVTLSADRMAAFVTVRPGDASGAGELTRMLERAGVVVGLDAEALEWLTSELADPSFEVADAVIARGIAPEAGEHGRVELLFAAGIQPGHLRDDGTFDFHDRELLKPVAAGEVIGRVWPARAGKAGQLVDGTRLEPLTVTEASLTLGEGAELHESGEIRARRAGVVSSKGASIDVVDRVVHEGAVDLRSGDLHMKGSLVVQGDVLGSFCVEASGDIEIRGSVEGSVHAGGNLQIQRGIRGSLASSVTAEGDLSAQQAEYAELYCGGLLRLGVGVHAKLSAQRVEISNKLRGGVTQAERGVLVREAGSPQGVQTEVEAGVPLESAVERAQRALERAKAVRNVRPVSRSERAKGEKLGRVQAALQAAEIQRLAQREHRRAELTKGAFIQIGVAYPGVIVRIAGKQFVIDHETRGSRFSLDRETRELRLDKVAP